MENLKRYAAHPKLIILPPIKPAKTHSHELQIMQPAVLLNPEIATAIIYLSNNQPKFATQAATNNTLSQQHQQFLQRQAATYKHYINTQQQLFQQWSGLINNSTIRLNPQAIKTAVRSDFVEDQTQHLPGPKFSRQDLEWLASDKISKLFGDWFKPLDQYEKLIRMPEPPLLLADRVTGIAGEPGSMGRGIIWTETDVKEDSWYLHNGRMPAGIMIEAGQADLLLASWLGFDFNNRGERVYRLLGCELSYHGELPQPGDTLCYDIHIDGSAKQGDIQLFFFHYDCRINGEIRLKVRNGQAGFFTTEELANSNGVLWDTLESKDIQDKPFDAPLVNCQYKSFNKAQLQNYADNKITACFGEGYEWTLTHTRTPHIDNNLLLLDEITDFDPTGGPYKRGYMRATQTIQPNDWFFKGHFKNDPCMPGTLMLEVGLQVMAFYLTALGYTLKRDGWRFEPVMDSIYKMQCRGQVIPTSKQVVYEIFITSVIAAPKPVIFAELLATVDGLKAFHTHIGLSLVPDWPVNARHSLLRNHVETKPVAEANGFKFDYASLLASALGKPSTAFGPFYKPFDGYRYVARLPGPSYHFMTRITYIKENIGCMKAGAEVVCEYDVPKDAWYFEKNTNPTMPFCVLLEVALQPCGWLASYVGSALTSEEDLIFRNLDGTGTILKEVWPDIGTIRTHVKCTNISQSGGMIIESFTVHCYAGEELIYKNDTVFGFFPHAAFVNQVGLPVPTTETNILTKKSDFYVDLTADIALSKLNLPSAGLLMIDRVTGFWPKGGKKDLGQLRAEKSVRIEEWFFKAHFFQDPVQPGSLGLEAMIHLLQFYILNQNLHKDFNNPRFQPLAVNKPLTWKYRGQVTPANNVITTIIDIMAIEHTEQGLLVTVDAALWVDQKRVYEAKNLGMRVEENKDTKQKRTFQEKYNIDPATEQWINDHKPNYIMPTLPMMSMVDLIALSASKHFPDKKLTAMENIQVLTWSVIDKPTVLIANIEIKNTEQAEVVLLQEKNNKQTAFAKGTVKFANDYSAQPALPSQLIDAKPINDPYLNLFHGSAFKIMESLVRNDKGATAILNAKNEAVPFGCLNQVLLDGATHSIPHDSLKLWSNDIANDQAGYPALIPKLNCYSQSPQEGMVQCEARFIGFHLDKRFPKFEITLVVAGKVWMQLQLVDALFPKGQLGIFPPEHRRTFLENKQYVADMRLSKIENGQFYLTTQAVKEIDWIEGSLAKLYEVEGNIELITQHILIKEHLAQQLKVHPADIIVEQDNITAAYKHKLDKKYLISTAKIGDKFIIN